MLIKRGTSAEMLRLWNGRFESFVEDHVSKIDRGIQEVWLMKDEEKDLFIGELHILWDHEDKDFANGTDTAYIMAFRIDEAYQGRKLGTRLMNRVLERIREKGYKNATIGADDHDPKLRLMYEKWGFTRFIKNSSFDYMFEGRKVTCTFPLLKKEIV